jgi:NAD(P)-dependent dehydrogenase (short-subunit alcohol dehydrogenase family)
MPCSWRAGAGWWKNEKSGGFLININVIAPGLIDTDMSRKRGINHLRHFVAWPRIGKPEDVAGVVAFLLSDEEFITGQVLSPNGGAYM